MKLACAQACLILIALWNVGILAVELQHPIVAPHRDPSLATGPATGAPDVHTLTLKSIYHHASSAGPIPGLFRRWDVPTGYRTQAGWSESFPLKSTWGTNYRPVSHSYAYEHYRLREDFGRMAYWSSPAQYSVEPMLHPNVTDRPTVLALAMMTFNAYQDVDNSTEWYDLGAPWHWNSSFGWESDGLRGHVFANLDESLVVVSIKGTSVGLLGGGPTSDNDKQNDNVLFSCCCARISRAWTPVCDCYQGNEYRCESRCLQKSISQSQLYYDHAMAIIDDVTKRFENATVWLTGHSLGGALASLVGQTFGLPTVAFESPGDRMASERLHLPNGPAVKHAIWHFGHTADPVFVGVCMGATSSCWYGGFAMEARCHAANICAWDTVNDYGWRVDARTHRIQVVIESILKDEAIFPMPSCKPEDETCKDCGLWEFVDERDPVVNSTVTKTTSASSTHADPPADPWRRGPTLI